MGRIGREVCAFNLRCIMFISVQRVKTYDFNNKNFENSLLVSIQIWKKLLSFFRKFKGKFLSQIFFFTFSTFQVKIHTLAKKIEKKIISLFWRQTKLTSEKIDVWHLKSMAQSFLSTLPINFKIRFTRSMWKRFSNIPN